MSCLILDPAQPGQLEHAARLLRADHPVALPTETVYGLAGRVSSEAALSRVFALKARPHFDPLIVHVTGPEQAALFAAEVTSLHRRLMDRFWPGPLTLLFRRNPCRVPDLCTAGSDWVALRCPEHDVFQRMIELVGEPLAAPSANRFGRISPTDALDVVRELGPYGLEAVVDGGPCRHGIESTVLKVASESQIEVLRPGSLALETLREVIEPGVQLIVRASTSMPGKTADAPGMQESHYAPRTSLEFVAGELPPPSSRQALLLVYPSAVDLEGWGRVEILSPQGSDVEAAARLFKTLRALDDEGFDKIIAAPAPDVGLGLAINDRLRRAGGKR